MHVLIHPRKNLVFGIKQQRLVNQLHVKIFNIKHILNVNKQKVNVLLMELLAFHCKNVLNMEKLHVTKEQMVYAFLVFHSKERLLLNLVDPKNAKMFTMHKIIKAAKISYQVNNVFLMVLIVFLKHNVVLTKLLQLAKGEALMVKKQPFVYSSRKKLTLKMVLVKHSLNVQMQKKMN